jgi:hypothetical protein
VAGRGQTVGDRADVMTVPVGRRRRRGGSEARDRRCLRSPRSRASPAAWVPRPCGRSGVAIHHRGSEYAASGLEIMTTAEESHVLDGREPSSRPRLDVIELGSKGLSIGNVFSFESSCSPRSCRASPSDQRTGDHRRRVTLGFAGCLAAEPHDSEPSGACLSLKNASPGSLTLVAPVRNEGFSCTWPRRWPLALALQRTSSPSLGCSTALRRRPPSVPRGTRKARAPLRRRRPVTSSPGSRGARSACTAAFGPS